MSKVFVSQQTLRRSEATGEMVQFPNLGPAENFGEVVFLLDWYEAMDMDATQMMWAMRRRLAEFSDEDYLLPLGSPCAMVFSAILASEANDGKIKILQWAREERAYEVRKLDLHAQPLNTRIGE